MASSSASADPLAKRRRVLADIGAISGSRVSAARILKKLHDDGHLKDTSLFDVSVSSMRRDAATGTADAVANLSSMYGPMLQTMELGDVKVEFVNPFTYIYCMCKQHQGLYRILADASGSRRIVMYIDEVKPGNPLRHDKGRTTQAVYWTFADMPDRMLTSEATWFVVAAIRST